MSRNRARPFASFHPSNMSEGKAPESVDTRFWGKTVVVTGGGGNFGRAGALFFAEQKANVVVVDVMPDPLAETMGMMPEGCGAISVLCDITKVDQVAAMTKSAVDAFGKIDMLWNNVRRAGEGVECSLSRLVQRSEGDPTAELVAVGLGLKGGVELRCEVDEATSLLTCGDIFALFLRPVSRGWPGPRLLAQILVSVHPRLRCHCRVCCPLSAACLLPTYCLPAVCLPALFLLYACLLPDGNLLALVSSCCRRLLLPLPLPPFLRSFVPSFLPPLHIPTFSVPTTPPL